MSRTLLSLLFLHELFHETAQPQTPSWDYALTKSSMRLLIHELYHVNVTNSTISTTDSPMRLLIHGLVHQSYSSTTSFMTLHIPKLFHSISRTLPWNYASMNSSMWISQTPFQTQRYREHSTTSVLLIHELFNETANPQPLPCEYHELYNLYRKLMNCPRGYSFTNSTM